VPVTQEHFTGRSLFSDRLLIGITALAVIAKIIPEIQSGQALLTHTAWPSVPEVHAVGFLCGLGWYVLPVKCYN
jgi:hypothetical protein